MASTVPNALTAPAFEHLDDLPGVSVHHCSYQVQLVAAEAATPGRGTLNLSDFFRLKYLHGPTPIQSESRHLQTEYGSLEKSCRDGNLPVALCCPKWDSLLAEI